MTEIRRRSESTAPLAREPAGSVAMRPAKGKGRSATRGAPPPEPPTGALLTTTPPSNHGQARRSARLAPKQVGVGGCGAVPWRVARGDDARPPLAEVEALRRRYGQSGPVGRPEERFLCWAAELDGMLARLPDEGLVDQALAADLRRPLFMLEGLLRLYRHRHGKAFVKQLEAVKRLEDQLGEVDYLRGVLAGLGKVGAPGAALRHLRDRLARAEGDLVELLRDGWLPSGGQSRRVAKLLHALAKAEWGSYPADRAFLREELGRRLGKVADLHLEMSEHESGLHELRRQIRWPPIYFLALGGVARLVDDWHPIPEYAQLNAQPVAQAKYAQLPASDREREPWPLPRSLYLANTRFIDELGEIKDALLVVDALAEALHASGAIGSRKAAVKAARRYLGHDKASLAALEQRAAAIDAELRERGLFRRWRRALLDA